MSYERSRMDSRLGRFGDMATMFDSSQQVSSAQPAPQLLYTMQSTIIPDPPAVPPPPPAPTPWYAKVAAAVQPAPQLLYTMESTIPPPPDYSHLNMHDVASYIVPMVGPGAPQYQPGGSEYQAPPPPVMAAGNQTPSGMIDFSTGGSQPGGGGGGGYPPPPPPSGGGGGAPSSSPCGVAANGQPILPLTPVAFQQSCHGHGGKPGPSGCTFADGSKAVLTAEGCVVPSSAGGGAGIAIVAGVGLLALMLLK